MAQKDSDLQRIKELIEIMKRNGLIELEIKHGDDKIFLKRCQPQQPGEAVVPTVGPKAEGETADIETVRQPGVEPSDRQTVKPEQEQELEEIKSPIVGTFYVAPSPDSEAFVEVGSHVSPQTVVCIVEAMKVMNEIKAETNGTITEVLVTNGQAVEYGQVLFKVKPD